jgi:hypothetical protein
MDGELMLNVTKCALDRLCHRLACKKAAADVALRFTRRDGGWKLGPDQKRPGDVVFAHEGRNVLLLDETAALAMTDLTLVVRKTDAGPRLRLRRIAGRAE